MGKALLNTPSSQLAWDVSVRDPLPAASSVAGASPASLRTERSGSRAATMQEHGFLGSTSFNAVFTDNIEQIGLEVSEANPDFSLSDKLHAQITALQKWPHRLKDAITVLKYLQDFTHFQHLVEKWWQYDRPVSVIGPWVSACEEAIRTELIETDVLKSEERMAIAAEQLFANTEERIVPSKDLKFNDFTKDYTGSKLRWEALGVFFTACGLSVNCLRADDTLLDFVGHKEENRQHLMFRLLEVSNACMVFCEDAGQASDLGLWLALENCIYNSQVLGDAHYMVWRKVGDLSTAIFAQGLHQENHRNSDQVPFWLNEMRRRGLANAYSIDKVLCTFVGRPPRISKRYCTVTLPLDLENHELALEGEELQRAINSIDENGWNTVTKDRRSAYQRSFIQCALLREEILEVCLGPQQADDTDRAHDIIRRNQKLHASLPAYIQHQPDMWMTTEAGPSFLAALEYLDFLYNEFMLRRMLVRRQHESPSELFTVAQRILNAVTEARNIRGSLTANNACIAWIVVLFGLPASGVLALHLLQEMPGVNLNFNRAKVIQDLSVFVSCLRWAHQPGDGNYQLTEQARKTLQQILDKVLAPGFQPAAQQPPVMTPNSNALPEDLVYDFNWTDTANFDTDFWMNLPDHPIMS